MAFFDMPLDRLREYRPALTREPDFDRFWSETLALAREIPLKPELTPIDYPAEGLIVARATYAGWDGARVSGIYLAPQGPGPFPAMVFYHGYSGSKGSPYDYLGWAYQGYAVFAVDCRGQNGESEDPTVYPSGHLKGWMTKGILDPATYYYRGVFVDSVRALDFVCARPEVDASRIGITGISQGGGLTLAVAALDPRPRVAMPEVPYLCDYRRAVAVTDQMPYAELIEFCRSRPGVEERAFRTLSYFDNLNLAPRIQCPTLVSVGLMDQICPPSTVFGAYNHLGAEAEIAVEKEITVYTFGVHAVYAPQWEAKLRWAKKHMK